MAKTITPTIINVLYDNLLTLHYLIHYLSLCLKVWLIFRRPCEYTIEVASWYMHALKLKAKAMYIFKLCMYARAGSDKYASLNLSGKGLWIWYSTNPVGHGHPDQVRRVEGGASTIQGLRSIHYDIPGLRYEFRTLVGTPPPFLQQQQGPTKNQEQEGGRESKPPGQQHRKRRELGGRMVGHS